MGPPPELHVSRITAVILRHVRFSSITPRSGELYFRPLELFSVYRCDLDAIALQRASIYYACKQRDLKKLINMCLYEINDAAFIIWVLPEIVSLCQDNREDTPVSSFQKTLEIITLNQTTRVY